MEPKDNQNKELNDKSNNNLKKIFKSYTIAEKLKAIEIAEKNSNHFVEENFGIDRKNVRRWRNQKNDLIEAENKKKKKLPGGGRKAYLNIDEESKLINRIKENRNLGIAITSHSVLLFIQKLKPEFAKKNNHTQKELVYRFLHRNGFSFRRPSHIGQPLPSNYADLFLTFQKKVILSKKNLLIDDNSFDRIINVDETPLYMEMPANTTIEKKGTNNIEVCTFGGEKVRISLILGVSGNGYKLPPVLIFKAKKDGRLEKTLNELELVKQKKIYIYCQENAWSDYDIFKKWIDKIYLDYQDKVIKNTCLLILDKAPSHCCSTIIEYLNNKNIKRIFIPGGLTRKLQPLDIAVNKPFKDHIKKNFAQYEIDNNNNIITNHHAKVDRKIIVDWVCDIWYNKIEPKIIINGFKKTGITAKNDGSEDDLATEACLASDDEDIKEDFSNDEESEEDEFSNESD